jgi:aminopeptidase N
VNEDTLWRAVLLGLNQEFFQQTVGTEVLVDYMSEVVGFDVAPLAKQYLIDTRLPVLEYGFRDGQLRYRYAQVGADFAMPVDVKVEISGPSEHKILVVLETRLEPTNRWQELDVAELIPLKEFARFGLFENDESDFPKDIYWELKIQKNFYVGSLEVNPGEKGVE